MTPPLPSRLSQAYCGREQPVLDNSLWAEALLTLAHLTGDEGYHTRAESTLNIFEPCGARQELLGRPRLPSYGRGRGGLVPPRGGCLGTRPGFPDPWPGQPGPRRRFVQSCLPPAPPVSVESARSPSHRPALGHRTGRRPDPQVGFPAQRRSCTVRLRRFCVSPSPSRPLMVSGKWPGHALGPVFLAEQNGPGACRHLPAFPISRANTDRVY